MIVHAGSTTEIAVPRHSILEMTSPDAAAAWDDLLTLQVELSFAHELSYFLESGVLSSASSVLDAGCGNGEYMARLAPFFRATAWTGIDSAPAMIAAAQKRFAGPRLRFLAADFFSFEPETPFGAILMRLLIQHLTDFSAVLAQAARCVSRVGGVLLLIEPDLENTLTMPPLPAFETMIREYEAAAARGKRLRTQINDVPALVGRSPEWRLADDRRIGVPVTGPFGNGKITRMYLRWIELCERSGSFRYPFARVREELADWAARPAAFARFGVRIFRLERA
jgi:SAM-dependent methyltransferase